MTEKQIATIRAMHDKGFNRTEIAVRVGCSDMTVFNRLKEYRTEKRATMLEREAVVAWLRDRPGYGPVADSIERSEHLKVKP